MRELLSALPLGTARKEGAGKLLFACRTQYFRSPQAERGGLTLQGREGLDLADGTPRRTHFEVARVLPFYEPQIRAYFEANLPAIPLADIWRVLEEIHAPSELATRPYLLNLIRRQLPALNAKVEKNEPVRALDLYRGFVDDWGHERNKFHNILLPEDKNDLMEKLAAHLWQLRTKTLLAAPLPVEAGAEPEGCVALCRRRGYGDGGGLPAGVRDGAGDPRGLAARGRLTANC